MRLFFAVDIKEIIKSKIDEFVFKNYHLLGNNKLSWVKKDNLHITLKFLGETREELLPEINEIMFACVKKYKKFKIEIKGISAFPKISLIKILWLGINNDSGELAGLFSEIEVKISELGFEKEKRPFKPHLTIARVRTINDLDKIKFFIEKFKDINFGMCEIEDVKLYQSILKPEGSEYKVIEKYCLA
ncbi:MAG: RNA 2',3'-cyclic phosphodiesterase [Endomicrobiia bacterium]